MAATSAHLLGIWSFFMYLLIFFHQLPKGSVLHPLITGTYLRSCLLLTSAVPGNFPQAVLQSCGFDFLPLFPLLRKRTTPHITLCVCGEKRFGYFCLSRLLLDGEVQLSRKQRGACDRLQSVFVIF